MHFVRLVGLLFQLMRNYYYRVLIMSPLLQNTIKLQQIAFSDILFFNNQKNSAFQTTCTLPWLCTDIYLCIMLKQENTDARATMYERLCTYANSTSWQEL